MLTRAGFQRTRAQSENWVQSAISLGSQHMCAASGHAFRASFPRINKTVLHRTQSATHALRKRVFLGTQRATHAPCIQLQPNSQIQPGVSSQIGARHYSRDLLRLSARFGDWYENSHASRRSPASAHADARYRRHQLAGRRVQHHLPPAADSYRNTRGRPRPRSS